MPGTPNRSGGNRRLTGSDLSPPDGLPKPAADLTADEQAAFADLLELTAVNLLRRIDGTTLSLLARLTVREQTLAAALAAEPENLPLGRQHLQVVAQVCRMSAVFGMSPGDRQRLKVPDDTADQDVFLSIMTRMGSDDGPAAYVPRTATPGPLPTSTG